jgi:hypothetical protein
VIAICLLLQTPWGQRTLKEKAVAYLQNKLQTKVSIGQLSTNWLYHIQLRQVYLEDPEKRVLLSVGSLDLKYDVLKIFSKNIDVSYISIDSVHVNLHRARTDSNFNYNFIIKAFALKEPVEEPVKEKPKPDSTVAYRFNLGTVLLSRIVFSMKDEYGGQDFLVNAGSLQSKFTDFDLEKMNIGVKYLYTDSISTAIDLSAPYKKTVPDTTASTPLQLRADSIRLQRTAFSLKNAESEMNVETHAGLLTGTDVLANLDKMNITVNRIQLIDHSSSIVVRSIEEPARPSATQKDSSKPLTFSARSVIIERNKIDFIDKAKKPTGPKTVDFANLGLSEITLLADTVGYDGRTYFASLKQLSAIDKSGFRLKHLSSNVRYTDTGVVAKNIVLQTNANQLEADAAVSYRSVATISNDPGRTKILGQIRNGKLTLDELLYFQPDLRNNASVRALLGKTFYVNTIVAGTLNKLHIPSLTLRESSTYLEASADVYNLPDAKKLFIDLHLKEFTGLRRELLALLPPNTIADSLLHYIPEKFTIKGTYKGTMQDLFADLQLKTSDGDISIKGTLKDITDKNKARYDLEATTSNLQLNKLLQDTLFGPVSARVKVKGRGLDIYTADATYDVSLANGVYQRYQYRDVAINGNIAAGKIKANIKSGDPNLLLTSVTEYDLSKQKGSFKTDTHISNVDLFKLNFAKDTFTVRGDINGDFPELDTTKINGDLLVSNLSIQSGSQKFSVDSITLNAKYAADTQTVQLIAPFVDATLKGQYTLQSFPAAIQTITNRYIYTTSKDTLYTKRVVAELHARVRLPDSMMALIPGLKYLDPFTAEAKINTDSSKLSFSTTVIKKIVYNQYEIDSVHILTRNSTRSVNYNTLFYNIGFKSLTSPSFVMAQSRTLGTINHGVIKGRVALSDQEARLRYNIPYSITNDPAEPFLKIGDSLLLDRKLWSVNENNIIYLDLKALKGTNLQIARNEQSISIIADSSKVAGLPLSIRLNNFELRNVSDIFVSDTTLINGTINGQAYFENFDPATFTTDITIDSLKVKSVNAGRFTAKVSRKTTDNFDVDVQLKGKNNDATFTGEYNPNTKLADFKLNLTKFDVQTAEPFVQEYLSKLTGNLKGQMAITGNLDNPAIRGTLQMDTLETLYKDYGSVIKIPTASLNFTEEGVNFNNFNFADSAGNKASLNGSVYTRDYKSFKFDLRLKADNFLAIGGRKSPDQNIYGPTYVDALLTLKGGSEEVLIAEGSVKVRDKSSFTYVYTSENNSQRSEGLIEFFDPAHPEDTVKLKLKEATSKPLFAVNMYLNVTPKSTVNIMLDELSGDNLKLNGTAALNLTMSPDGQTSLVGNYVVESGEYDLSLAQVIRKKFSIEKGSTITWTGDPLKADVNITAVYKTRTSAGELLRNMSSLPAGADKQKFNFEVYLVLKKQLLQPEISFRIDMPTEEQDAFNGVVYTKIRQVNNSPSELNKQVMGLLALNHFIADNPFNSLAGGGSSLETQAYTTAGKILTQELTDMVGGIVKGVDISFDLDVNDDYSSGTAVRNTDLKVGVSKSLADNRLSVYVGSTFALEGQNQNEKALSGLAGDITLEYLLTTDGKYRLKVYRINENDYTFGGNVVETGVTFVVVLEFNKLKNAFRTRRAKKS